MIGLIVSFLVASAQESMLVKAFSRLFKGGRIIKDSKTALLIKNLFAFFVRASRRSFFSKVITSLSLLLSPLFSSWGKLRNSPIIAKTSSFLNNSYFIDHLLSPIAFPLMILAFFAVANVLYGLKTLILIFSGITSFLIGIFWGSLESRRLNPKVKDLTIFSLGLIMLVIGFLGFFLQIGRVMAIPILNEAVRRRLSPKYNYMAWTSVPGTFYVLSTFKKEEEESLPVKLLLLIVIGFVPTFLLGYRTEMLAYFIGVLTVLYYRKYMSKFALLLWAAFGVIIYVVTSVVRLMFAGLTANPLWAAAYRPTITAGFLEGIVMRYGWSQVTGGLIHLSGISSLLRFIPGPRYGPRTIIGIYAGGRRTISTTATIFAQFLLDFGFKGVILAFLALGFLLSIAFNMSKKKEALSGPYATLLSYALVGIETGILDLNVYIYLIMSSIIVILSLRAKTKETS
ncbi:MAG: hypothetical protein DRN92_01490 [Thermoproteota archaeon]|nr:MAG: hypothetical protein DRN92_01490 [Candidatus Korarchaeota archaeon]